MNHSQGEVVGVCPDCGEPLRVEVKIGGKMEGEYFPFHCGNCNELILRDDDGEIKSADEKT